VRWKDGLRGVEIEPSIYAADFLRLGEQIQVLLVAGARVFHIDVGDGRFIPPVTIGPVVVKAIAPLIHEAGGVLDCHLMVVEPQNHFEEVKAAGGDSVTFHLEACDDVAGTAGRARELGLGVGIAVNPGTRIEVAAEAAEGMDLALCMSVVPGYSGQAFLPEAVERLARLRELVGPDVLVQVDGGIGSANVAEVRAAGADLIVAGSSIFYQDDIAAAYQGLARAAG
jgi:ribulose-phosphate 3-epimerase